MWRGTGGGSHIVNDLDTSIAYYTDNFGLKVDRNMPSSTMPVLATLVGIPDVEIHEAFLSQEGNDGFRLLLIEFVKPKGRARSEPNDVGTHMMGFSSDDLEGDCAKLIANGGRLAGELADFGNGRKLAWALDPDGVILRLAQAGQGGGGQQG